MIELDTFMPSAMDGLFWQQRTVWFRLSMSFFILRKKEKTHLSYANSEDPDQTPRLAASDLGLHCLPVSYL